MKYSFGVDYLNMYEYKCNQISLLSSSKTKNEFMLYTTHSIWFSLSYFLYTLYTFIVFKNKCNSIYKFLISCERHFL